VAEVMAAILYQEPSPLRRYTRDAPAELERIVGDLTFDRQSVQIKDLALEERVTYITPRHELGQAHSDGSALVLGALMFLAVTIPLARLVDVLIAREQRKIERGGGGAGERVGPGVL